MNGKRLIGASIFAAIVLAVFYAAYMKPWATPAHEDRLKRCANDTDPETYSITFGAYRVDLPKNYTTLCKKDGVDKWSIHRSETPAHATLKMYWPSMKPLENAYKDKSPIDGGISISFDGEGVKQENIAQSLKNRLDFQLRNNKDLKPSFDESLQMEKYDVPMQSQYLYQHQYYVMRNDQGDITRLIFCSKECFLNDHDLIRTPVYVSVGLSPELIEHSSEIVKDVQRFIKPLITKIDQKEY